MLACGKLHLDKDTRPECKYGSLCYQKNDFHNKKYKHPPKRKIEEEPCGENSPKRQKLPGDELTGDVCKGEFTPTVKETIKRMFLVNMPEDFYSFWDFCASLCPKKPEDALKDCGLSLVGPFDVLSGKLKENDARDASEYLTYWRYYYDPPEFQTVLRGDDKKKFHMGYFRDEPGALPCFVAGNSAAVNCVITPVAENLFGAVNSHLESTRRVSDPFRKLKLKKMQDTLQSWVKGKALNLDTSTAKMKEREQKVLARTFHKAGIVVPYNKKSDLGYRPLLVTEAELKITLKKIAESKSDEERDRNMESLQPVLTAASIANDECDFGTGLELGLDLFSYGRKVFHPTALHLLTTAYSLLNRGPFAEIVKAHLSQRRSIP